VPTKARKLIAKSSIQINNTVDEAWKALVDPEIVAKYMLGSQQVSDWQKGSSIIWRKDFNGRRFEDKGEILEITLQKSLKYTHYSPASGKPDAPENYQTVSVTLKENIKGTTIELSSDNNASEIERRGFLCDKGRNVIITGAAGGMGSLLLTIHVAQQGGLAQT
jgi:uncharacterized protein YndB with AHSA1/START domain